MNLLRRHLDPLRWGIAFKKLLKLKGVRRGKGRQKKRDKTSLIDAKAIAAEVGVGERKAKRCLKLADDYAALRGVRRGHVGELLPTLDLIASQTEICVGF